MICAWQPVLSNALNRSSTTDARTSSSRAAELVTHVSPANSASTAPLGQGCVEHCHRRGGLGAGEPVSFGGETLEPDRIDVVDLGAQHVARRLADEDRRRCTRQALRLQSAPQVRHVRVERAGRPCRRLIAPYVVDQPLGRHDHVDVQHQQRQHRSLSRTTEIDRHTVVAGGHERTEQAKAHQRSVTPSAYQLVPQCTKTPPSIHQEQRKTINS